MSKLIYTEPDMNKKVKFNRVEMEERIVDIYVSADTLRDGETSTKREETADTAPNNGPGDQHSDNRAIKDSEDKRNNLSQSWSLYKTNATAERDQLQTRYNNLTEERDQLQTRYNNLTEEKGHIQLKLFVIGQYCQEGWRYFDSSLYFLSTEKKTWEESRQDCKRRGADLVIINSREEQLVFYLSQQQTFLFNLHLRAWIGLNDSVTEETWKWVDGTTLTTGYWSAGQPDDNGQEDCVEIYYGQDDPVKTWNDENCHKYHDWICEKVV
ncbi:CD209 antigen-like protein E isoform X3 [Oncorhynchus kisutch]|uniref:CD209 antigen-like protein E isoform X3 n=2 Tax=Oncorhynchus kisutch TaxID=8019 RepID=UPI0012DD37C0|nr:CD209 antigen-like protein E isoform X3 [Oncorhynchus kisutch]